MPDGEETVWVPLPRAVVETMANVDSALGRACQHVLDPSQPPPELTVDGATSYDGFATFDYPVDAEPGVIKLWCENDGGQGGGVTLSVKAIPPIMNWLSLVSRAERK